MASAYLDTSGYGDIRQDDVDGLRKALKASDVVLLPSMTVVEELLGPWETNRSAAVRRLRLSRDLVGFDGMLKPAGDLLEDAIRAYATGSQPASPILPRRPRRFIAAALKDIAAGRPGVSGDVSAIIVEVGSRKQAFQRSMTEALQRARADVARSGPYSREEREAFTFEAFWTKAATSWAEEFAERVDLGDASRARGLEGLLDVRPVRLAVGAVLSLLFPQVRGEVQPDPNDGYDIWHVIGASAADAFVTQDQALAQRLERVPVNGFRVVRSLRELLPEPSPAGTH